MSGYEQRNFALPADATELLLVRHGASQPAQEGQSFPLLDGHGDPALSEVGRAQAVAVAGRLAAEPLAAVFVTTLRRTVESAAPLAERLGLEPITIADLREVHLGDWEGGELRIRAATGDPLMLTLAAEQRWDVIPNAETMDSLERRVRAGVQAVVAALGPGATGAVFVHGGVIGEICRQATGSHPFAFLHADNASITRLIVFADGRWLLRGFNDVSHL